VSKKYPPGFKTQADDILRKAGFLFLIGVLETSAPGKSFAAEPLMDTSIFMESRVGATNSVKQGHFGQALKSEQTALKIAQDEYGPTSLFLVPILDDVAVLQWRLAEYRDSEGGLKWGLALVEKNLGPDDLEAADSLDLLAGLYSDQNRLQEAEGLEKRALALRQTGGAANPQALARTQDLLGLVELGLKNNSQAQALFLEAQKNFEKAGKTDPDFSIHLLKHLALACAAGNDLTQAQSRLEKALETAEKDLKPDSPGRTGALEDLADFYQTHGQPEKAKPLWESALKLAKPMVGMECDYLALPYFKRLARAEEGVGDHQKARDLWLKILHADKAVFGNQHPSVALDLMALAGLEKELGQKGKAKEELKESLTVLKTLFPKGHPLVLEASSQLEELSK
jgi:tetratricopeptide (TPR) repeat protein